MNKHMILVLAIVFSSMALASANSICNNALCACEKPINVGLGKDFTISLKSYTGAGSTGGCNSILDI